MEKKIFVFFIVLFFIFLSSCENNIILSFNPEKFKEVTFLKAEKVDPDTGEVVCDPNFETDTYYLYFTLEGNMGSTITSSHPTMGDIGENFEISFLTNAGTVDTNVVVDSSSLEWVRKSEHSLDTQHKMFVLMDFSKKSTQTGTSNISGGVVSINNLITSLDSFLTNVKSNYDDEHFPTKSMFAVKFAAFTSDHIEAIDTVSVLNRTYLSGLDNILSYLSIRSDKMDFKSLFNGTNSGGAVEYRKLFDAYKGISVPMNEDSTRNQNLLMFVNGYEESFYDDEAGTHCTEGNYCSTTTEDEVFQAAESQKFPTFIVANRANLAGFPDNDKGDEIDAKYRKLACLSDGVYFSETYEQGGFTKLNNINITDVLNSVNSSIYGMWRIKVEIRNDQSDLYSGEFNFSYTKNSDQSPAKAYYKIFR